MDISLIQQLANGDVAAFESVFIQTHEKAYRVAVGVVKDEFDAEDIVQEAYITMMDKLGQLENPARFESWFYQIVRNKAIDELRKKRPAPISGEDDAWEDKDGKRIDPVESISSDYIWFEPEAMADYRELQRILEDMIAKLPEAQRKCILLRFQGNLKISEIAQTLQMPVPTVKSNLNYGKKKLQAEVAALEKKGVKLYSVTPLLVIAFLRWCWGSQIPESCLSALPSGGAAAVSLASSAPASGAASGSAASGSAAAAGAASAGTTGTVVTAAATGTMSAAKALAYALCAMAATSGVFFGAAALGKKVLTPSSVRMEQTTVSSLPLETEIQQPTEFVTKATQLTELSTQETVAPTIQATVPVTETVPIQPTETQNEAISPFQWAVPVARENEPTAAAPVATTPTLPAVTPSANPNPPVTSIIYPGQKSTTWMPETTVPTVETVPVREETIVASEETAAPAIGETASIEEVTTPTVEETTVDREEAQSVTGQPYGFDLEKHVASCLVYRTNGLPGEVPHLELRTIDFKNTYDADSRFYIERGYIAGPLKVTFEGEPLGEFNAYGSRTEIRDGRECALIQIQATGDFNDRLTALGFQPLPEMVVVPVPERPPEMETVATVPSEESGSTNTSEGMWSYHLRKDGTAVITDYQPPMETSGKLVITVPGEIDGKPVTAVGFHDSKVTSRHYSELQVVLPEGLNTIEDKSFYDCENLTSIVFPNSLTTIGSKAFYQCMNLEQVSFPAELKEIGDQAFSRCPKFREIIIPEGAVSIGEKAFYPCDYINKIELPVSITFIGKDAFYRIPSDSTTNNLYAYVPHNSYAEQYCLDSWIKYFCTDETGAYSCGLGKEGSLDYWKYTLREDGTAMITEYDAPVLRHYENPIMVPDSIDGIKVTSIGSNMFKKIQCAFSLVIPEGVTTIEKYAFSYRQRMTSIVLPQSLKEIGEEAFWCCSELESCNIPEGVQIGARAFVGCNLLDLPD